MKISKLILIVLVCLLPATLLAQNAAPSTLLITEAYYNTTSDDAVSEWIEIANVGGEPIDLSQISLGDAQTSGASEGMMRFPQESIIAAGQVIVVAQTAVSFQQNFGFKPDYEITDSDAAVPNMSSYDLWSSGTLALANDGD